MMGAPVFSLGRCMAIVFKEFRQLGRDRLTLGMIVAIPVVQLLLFGYAINNDPKNLPTAFVTTEQSQFSRSLEAALRNSEYFAVNAMLDEQEAARALRRGDVYFVVTVPTDFSKRLLRGESPSVLLEADATDPSAMSGAIGALQGIVDSIARKDFSGPLAYLNARPVAFSIQVHKLYNPEGLTRYNIVPGLIGVILALMTVMLTGLAITRERERGNMENLLASPVTPLEIMLGKIIPYILTGHVQAGIILFLALTLFHVPFQGDPFPLYVASVLFIAANLTVGVTVSSLARNQLQAMQMTFFYILPNIMLTGFMFPFAGMPDWARVLGSVLPLTYFNRVVRGVLLKGVSWSDLWPNMWPVLVFSIVVMALATRTFRRTLD